MTSQAQTDRATSFNRGTHIGAGCVTSGWKQFLICHAAHFLWLALQFPLSHTWAESPVLCVSEQAQPDLVETPLEKTAPDLTALTNDASIANRAASYPVR